MRWTLYMIVALFAAMVFGYDQFADRAFAVMDEAVAAPEPASIALGLATPAAETPEAVTPTPHERGVVRLGIPISWQLTRSKLIGPGATTLTESFRETWTLEILPTGRIFLESPRARVPAFDALATTPSPNAVPRSLVISERDLARLVGIKPAQDALEEDMEASVESIGRPVTLSLVQSGKGGVDVSLAWSEKEHFAVHLDFGNSTAY